MEKQGGKTKPGSSAVSTDLSAYLFLRRIVQEMFLNGSSVAWRTRLGT